ncbi:MAG: arylsulfatase A-like enzyme [Cryomorphaceae bacterium]|jgi:arylsulfatase A-like enzyme
MSINNFGLAALSLEITFASLMLSSLAYAAEDHSIDGRPNIVVILADDLGYSDIASYGSEISTPNLDRLAQQGLRFSSYYTSASCAPTRAMLLTGVDSHRAGVANIAEALTPEQAHSPFYRGSLNQNVVTIATLLKDTGYNTSMTGKWHLGYEDESLRPINRGFEQTVMMPFSGGDNWTNQAYLPNYEKTLWYKNGKEIEIPEDFYSSKFIIDNAIEQLKNKADNGKPFFSYVGFQAVHIPVQAPKEYTEKYIDTYSSGWTALREQRQQSVKDLGLIAQDAPMKTMKTTGDWDELSVDEQQYQAKRMAVYAGMVDAMDFHIGRLVQYLKDTGEYDNTVIIFTSDNGAEPSDPNVLSKLFPLFMRLNGYNNEIETLGEKFSYNTIGSSFASAAVSPLGHYKFHSGQGGIKVPMIISGPALADSHTGKITHSKAFVKDLAPTILALAGTSHPGTSYQGKTIEPNTGKNLLPVIQDKVETVYSDQDIIAYEIGGNAALIKGDYKITFNRGGNNDAKWHLYNVANDPGETLALESDEPAVFSDLLSEYQRYTVENGVLPVPKDYNQTKQVGRNGIKKRYGQPKYIVTAIVLIALLFFTVKAIRRRQKTTSL